MPTTNFEGIFNLAKAYVLTVILHTHSGEVFEIDQRIAMNAYKTVGEFLFQAFERILN